MYSKLVKYLKMGHTHVMDGTITYYSYHQLYIIYKIQDALFGEIEWYNFSKAELKTTGRKEMFQNVLKFVFTSNDSFRG